MKLSIITINLNNVIGLRKTIESVINQTSDSYEHIIIDGGSTDGSVKVIENFLQDKNYAKHVSYWCSEKDKGIYDAMNNGIDKASGDYCFFLNSGDTFCDTNVVKRVNEYCFDEDIVYFNILKVCNGQSTLHKYSSSIINEKFFYQNNICHQSVLIKTELQKRKKYSTNYKLVSDYAFLIDVLLIEKCTYRYIDDVLCNYDAEFGVSSREIDLMQNERFMVLRDYLIYKIKNNNGITYLYYDYEYAYGGLVNKFRKILNFISRITFRRNSKVYNQLELQLK